MMVSYLTCSLEDLQFAFFEYSLRRFHCFNSYQCKSSLSLPQSCTFWQHIRCLCFFHSPTEWNSLPLLFIFSSHKITLKQSSERATFSTSNKDSKMHTISHNSLIFQTSIIYIYILTYSDDPTLHVSPAIFYSTVQLIVLTFQVPHLVLSSSSAYMGNLIWYVIMHLWMLVEVCVRERIETEELRSEP